MKKIAKIAIKAASFLAVCLLFAACPRQPKNTVNPGGNSGGSGDSGSTTPAKPTTPATAPNIAPGEYWVYSGTSPWTVNGCKNVFLTVGENNSLTLRHYKGAAEYNAQSAGNVVTQTATVDWLLLSDPTWVNGWSVTFNGNLYYIYVEGNSPYMEEVKDTEGYYNRVRKSLTKVTDEIKAVWQVPADGTYVCAKKENEQFVAQKFNAGDTGDENKKFMLAVVSDSGSTINLYRGESKDTPGEAFKTYSNISYDLDIDFIIWRAPTEQRTGDWYVSSFAKNSEGFQMVAKTRYYLVPPANAQNPES